MNNNEQQTESYLQRISDILLINGGFLDSPGLYTGEMGLVLFFSNYYFFTKNELYLEYSIDLIEKIQNRIHQDTSINYKHGLAGIGATIEYLVQEGYVEADTDDILEDIDHRLFSINDLSHLTVEKIFGIGYYAIWRLLGKSALKATILKTVLAPIVNVMSEWSEKNNLMHHPIISFFNEVVAYENFAIVQDRPFLWNHLICRNSPYLKTESYNSFLEYFSSNDYNSINKVNLGIQNGLAGWGLSLLTELEGYDLWISLFPNDLIPLKNEPLPL